MFNLYKTRPLNGHGYVMQSYALANDIRDILNSEGL